jgi:hypothetical protein
MGRSFRVLYFFRAGFSAAWVALVSALASSAAPGGTPGVLAGILLVCYPVSDAAATVYDLRANPTARARWPQQVNLVGDVAAAGGILITLLAGLAAAITVFGVGHRERGHRGRPRGTPAPGARRPIADDHQRSRLRLRRDHLHRLDGQPRDRASRPRPVLGRRRPLVPPGRALATTTSRNRRGRRHRRQRSTIEPESSVNVPAREPVRHSGRGPSP